MRDRVASGEALALRNEAAPEPEPVVEGWDLVAFKVVAEEALDVRVLPSHLRDPRALRRLLEVWDTT